MKKKILSILLAVVLVVGMLPVAAFAAAEVSYLKWDDVQKKLVETSTSVYEVYNGGTALAAGTTYVVNGTFTVDTRITVSGTEASPTRLILCDGASLTANAGIEVAAGSALIIYGQSEGTGALTAVSGNDYVAGIGGTKVAGGTVIIHGGTVIANGGYGAAGIGGGFDRNVDCAGGSVTISGGTVNANGGCDGGAGIGGGAWYSGGTVTVNGGTVNANGDHGGAGIGGGVWASGCTVTVNGGVVNATGGTYDGGDGKVAGIGGGYGSTDNGTVSITDTARVLAGGAYPGEPKEISAYIADHSAKYVHIDTQKHTYAYTTDGATLIATCSETECHWPDHKLTLTLTKNGFKQTELKVWVGEGAEEPAISYYKVDDLTTSIDEPTATSSGKYVIKATVATVTVDFVQLPYNYKGDGQSPETAYELYTVSQLEDLAHAVNGAAPYNNAGANNMQGVYFKLTADIGTAADPVTTTIGNQNSSFAGHFDGAGHTVTLNIGGVDVAAELAGLGINEMMLQELTRMLEMGRMEPFELEHMLRDLPEGVSADDVLAIIAQGPQSNSGLFGQLGSGGEIKNVTTAGSVNGEAYVGGVCGRNFGGTITNCTNTGSVSGSGQRLGGVCGENSGTITNCTNTGSVNGEAYVGGVCGWNAGGTITNCYNVGSVNGYDTLGGVCGYDFGSISNCYSAGSVVGEKNVGGISGWNCAITNCYFDKEVAGVSVAFGSNQADTDTEKGLPTAKMKAASGTEGALVDLLNNYITAHPDDTVGWYSWKNEAGEYPTFKIVKTYVYSAEGNVLTATADDGTTLTLTLTEDGTISEEEASAWQDEGLVLPEIVYDTAANTASITAGEATATIQFASETLTPHSVKVICGTGTAGELTAAYLDEVLPGTVVTVTAGTYEGKAFDVWSGRLSCDGSTDATVTFIMPNEDVTLEAKFVDCYALSVFDGTTLTSTPQKVNESITVKLPAVPEGKGFICWTAEGLSLANPKAETVSFYMPANAVLLTANFADLHTVTVTGGTIVGGVDANSMACIGTTITIKPDDTTDDARFTEWSSEDGLVITEAANGTFTFIMPDKSVTVTASFEVSHTHSFSYAADGATLTATCANTDSQCDLDDSKLTLTLTAEDASYTGSDYDGASHDDDDVGFASATGATLGTIQYQTKSVNASTGAVTWSDATDTAPKEVGDYKATLKVTISETPYTLEKEFSITKATPTITTAPTASAITYGDTLEDSTLTGGVGSVDGTFAWTTKTTAPAVADSEMTEYEVTFTPTDTAHNNTTTCKVKVKVNKANYADAYSSAENAVASGSLKAKNGSKVEITLPGIPEGASYGTVTNNNTSYFTVGEINQETRKVTVTSAKDWNETQDGKDGKTFTVTVTPDGNHNGYTITVTIKPVYKTVVTITAEPDGFTYGDANKTGYKNASAKVDSTDVDGLAATLIATYYKETATAGTYETTGSTEVPKNAGNYKVTLSVPETNDDYTGSKDVLFTIAKKEIEIIWAEDNFTYNGENQTASITAKYKDIDKKEHSLIVDIKQGGNTKDFQSAGEYTAEVTGFDTGNDSGYANYALPATVTKTYTMKPKPVTVTAVPVPEKTYDGKTSTPLCADEPVSGATFDGLCDGDTLSLKGVTGTYASANVSDAQTVNLNAYTEWTLDNDNYVLAVEGQPTTTTGKISAFDLSTATVTVNPTAYDYTGNEIKPTLTVTFDGTNAIPPTDYKITYTNSTNAAASTDTNAPTVTIEPAVGNTNVTGSKSVKFTINKVDKPGTTPTSFDVNAVSNSSLSLEAIGITLAGAKITKVEAVSGKTGMVLSAAPSIINDGAAIQWTTVAQPSGTVDEQYTLTVSTDNYEDFTVTVSFKGKIPVTVNATGEDFVYGDADKTGYTGLSVEKSLVDAASLEFLYESTGTTAAYSSAKVPTDVGTYKVTISVPASNTTYMGSKTVEFAITQQEVAVPSENETVFTYDGEEKTYMTVAADALYKLAEDSAETSRTDAGSTTIKLTLKDTHNYKWADDAADPSYTFTIAKKTITITPNAGQKKTYGENDPAFSYQNTELCGEDTLSGALSRAVGETYDASGYAFTLGTLAVDPAANAGNYTLTLADDAPVFMIEKKVITVSDIIVADKVYDGKTDGAVITGYTLNGKKTEDTLTLTGITGTYASANVNAAQTVTLNDSSKWALEDTNYVLASEGQPTTAIGKITKAAQKAPTAPSVSGSTVTIAETDREKKLEYSLDSENAWISVPTLNNGAFTLSGLTVGDHTIYLRVKESSNYFASSSVSKAFELTQYSVAYNANGGIGSIASQTANSGSSVTVKSGSAMSRTGYTFAGWKDENGTSHAVGSTVSTGMTLYAQWEANTYTVRFNANGGNGTMAKESFTYDAAEALTANAFTRADYTFVGWATSANGAVLYTDEQEVKNLVGSGTVTLYAVWAQNVYSITVNITSPQSGDVHVKLQQGNAVYAQVSNINMSESSGKYTGSYSFTGVPAGTYNIVVEQNVDGKVVTMTQLVVLNADSTADIDLPESGVNSKLEVEEDTLPTVVGGLDEEAETNRQTGKDITVTMTVEKKEEQSLAATATAEDKATQDAISEIKATANGKTLDFMNIEIEKETKDSLSGDLISKEAITETSSVLELVFSYEMNGKKNIQIYRQHGDSVQTFTKLDTKPTTDYTDGTFYVDTANSLIYVYASSFSTYAIGYEEEQDDPYTPYTPVTPTYTITGADTENGKLTISRKNASAGQTVTITVKPDEGYKLNTLTVKNITGKELTLTKVNDTTYTFKMPIGKVTVSATFTEVKTACPQDETCVYAKFTDADTKAWYHDGVHFCVENGYMVGVAADKFAPSGTLSRAMIVTMLWRMEGSPVVNYVMSFEDVAVDQWYAEAIRWAQSTGVVLGYDAEHFGPGDPITREQMATILYRYAKYHEIDVANTNTLAGFTDVNRVSSWALDAMKWANAVGLVQGRTTTTLVPEVSITRAEAACMVQRYCEKVRED